MGKRILSLCMVLVLCVFILPFPTLAGGQDDALATLQAASDRGDNYPYADKVYGRYLQPDDVDPWKFFYRECTSFVAWCLNSRNGVAFHNTMGGRRWGNAIDWGATAQTLGYAVDNSPAVGSVAWSNAGKYGHVAWVSAVNGSQITVEEYNYNNNGRFNSRSVASSKFTGFIHIKDIDIPTGPLDLGNSFSAFVYNPSLDRYITNDGSNITSRIRTGTPKQLWNFQKNDNGSYKITSAADGKSWDVVYSGTSSGTNVQSIPYTGVGAQQWDIYGSEGAYYFSARCTGCVLDVANASSDDGANIWMYAYNGSGAQLFSIAKAQFNNVTDMGSDFYAYIILNESWTHFENRDRNVQLVRDNNDSLDPRQIWHFIKKDDGAYQIVSEYDGRCLDANNFGNTNGTNVSVVVSNDSSAQRWFVIKCDDNYFLMPSYCDLVLDADDGLSHGHGSNAQLWAFIKSGNQFLNIYNVENDKPDIDYKNEKPSAPQTPSISVDSAGAPVQISWTTSPTTSRYDNRTYSVDIFSGNSVSGNPVDSCTGLTVTSYEANLLQGEYTVRIRANNTKYENLYSESTQTFAVTPTTLTSLLIQSSPSKTVYKIGESLETDGLSVVAKYSDGTDKDLYRN